MPKVREAIRIVERDGWYHVRTRGSHRQFRHPEKPGKVTILGKPSDEVPKPQSTEGMMVGDVMEG